mgnify:CR=1 FL=1
MAGRIIKVYDEYGDYVHMPRKKFERLLENNPEMRPPGWTVEDEGRAGRFRYGFLNAEKDGLLRGQNFHDFMADALPELERESRERDEKYEKAWAARQQEIKAELGIDPNQRDFRDLYEAITTPKVEAMMEERLETRAQEDEESGLLAEHVQQWPQQPEDFKEARESASSRAIESNEQKRAALRLTQEKTEREQARRLADLKSRNERQTRSSVLNVPIGDVKPQRPKPRGYTSKGSMAPPRKEDEEEED